jgi:hypothetical protein
MNSLCNYIINHEKTEEDLVSLCSKSKEELDQELRGAWCLIAEALPNRSVQSCHNFCRRKFNPNNYNGKWSPEEEEHLLELIKENGHQWKAVAAAMNARFQSDKEQFGRTPENVKDKWKQLGGSNFDSRLKGPWTVAEAI